MAESKPTNPKDRAAVSKLDLSLFPTTAVAYGALAMTEGDAKYGGFNFRISGVKASVYIAACKRHLDKWYNGEECDPVSHVPHLANALACIAVIIDAKECDKLNDDRPPQCDMGRLLADFEHVVKHLHELYPNGPARCTNKSVPPEKAPEDPILASFCRGVMSALGPAKPEVPWSRDAAGFRLCRDCKHHKVAPGSFPCSECSYNPDGTRRKIKIHFEEK